MDQFPLVYDKYYEHAGHMSVATLRGDPRSFEESHSQFIGALAEKGLLETRARGAVRIVGVWDTVGFHASGRGDEKIEFHNLTLSPLVQFAFHALALDETRWPFKPSLWVKPREEAIGKGKKTLEELEREPFEQDMQQVWFSGYHSDIGGGLDDPRLSDISFAWMIAQCARTGLLDFTDLDSEGKETYLIDTNAGLKQQDEKAPWSTSNGRANAPDWFKALMRRFLSEDRRPLTIMQDNKTVEISDGSTNEMIHESVRDRPFNDWVCPAISGKSNAEKTEWMLNEKDKRGLSLKVAPLVKRVKVDGTEEDVELFFKGRVKGITVDDDLAKAAGLD